jgi:hypothetical protein
MPPLQPAPDMAQGVEWPFEYSIRSLARVAHPPRWVSEEQGRNCWRESFEFINRNTRLKKEPQTQACVSPIRALTENESGF